MIVETLSTFPHMYDSIMGSSMMKIAQEKGILDFRAHDLRDWTHDPTYQAFKRLQRAQN